MASSISVGRSVWIAALLASTTCAAMPAHAQSDAGLDQIVVTARRATTATKTDTPIVETPQAISVIGSDLFEDRGARNVQETLRYTAGVAAEAYGLDTRGETIAVRGLTPVEYLDGMRRIYNYSPLPRADVNTLERVEVLRGPSSVLYGQGANGGIVNLVSKRPLFERGGEIELQYGSFDRKQGMIDVTGALNADETIAGRMVALVRDSGMQTDKVPDNRIAVMPSFTWQPTERTSLTVIGLYQRDRTASSQQFLPVVATLQATGDRRLDVDTFLGDEDYDILLAKQFSGTLLFEHSFSDAMTLRSSLRYVDAESTFRELYPDTYSNPQDPFIDADDRVVNRLAYQIRPDVQTLTSDSSLMVRFNTGAFEHTMLAGVDYTDFDHSSQSNSDLSTPIDIYNPVSEGVAVLPYNDDPDQKNSQLGFYVQDQIRYADRVSLVLGARRDRAVSNTVDVLRQVDKATSFRAGLIGDVTAGISPYVSYSESFLPVAGLDRSNVAFVPVRGRQYEAGVKFQPMDSALITFNYFDIAEYNRPINDPNNPVNVIQTGRVTSEGVELEAIYAIADDFLITGAYSYNSAKVRESDFPAEIGVQLSDTPKHLASAWATKTIAIDQDLAMRLGAGVRHVGSTISTGIAGTLKTPSYTLADALVALDWDQWSLELNATNLFDKEYFAPCRAFGDCFTGNGRSVIGTVSRRF